MPLSASTKLTTPSKVHYSEYIITGEPKPSRPHIHALTTLSSIVNARVPHGNAACMRTILRIFLV